jgi:hypothetical protein
VIQPDTVNVEREFGVVLEKCFSQMPALELKWVKSVKNCA